MFPGAAATHAWQVKSVWEKDGETVSIPTSTDSDD